MLKFKTYKHQTDGIAYDIRLSVGLVEDDNYIRAVSYPDFDVRFSLTFEERSEVLKIFEKAYVRAITEMRTDSENTALQG